MDVRGPGRVRAGRPSRKRASRRAYSTGVREEPVRWRTSSSQAPRASRQAGRQGVGSGSGALADPSSRASGGISLRTVSVNIWAPVGVMGVIRVHRARSVGCPDDLRWPRPPTDDRGRSVASTGRSSRQGVLDLVDRMDDGPLDLTRHRRRLLGQLDRSAPDSPGRSTARRSSPSPWLDASWIPLVVPAVGRRSDLPDRDGPGVLDGDEQRQGPVLVRIGGFPHDDRAEPGEELEALAPQDSGGPR